MHTVRGPILPAELTGTRYKVLWPDHPVFKPPRSWTYACDDLLPYYRKTARDATPELKRAFERIIRMCIARHALDKANARFVNKSQVYTVRFSLVRELLKDYDLKFVLEVNNPWAALGKAQDIERLKSKLSFKERLGICSQHGVNSIPCALEDKGEDMLVVRFEDLLQDPERLLRQISEHLELHFWEDMLPGPQHKIPFGSRFRERWYLP